METATPANGTNQLIFLETPTAQAITGVFAWFGMAITIYQVKYGVVYLASTAYGKEVHTLQRYTVSIIL